MTVSWTALVLCFSRWSVEAADIHPALWDDSFYNAFKAIPVLIGYRNDQGKAHLEQHYNVQHSPGLPSIQTVRLHLDPRELKQLEKNPDLSFVEPDIGMELLGQIDGSGRQLIAPVSNSTNQWPNTGNCSDPSAFKIAIVDSGVQSDHPDLACGPSNCVGAGFGLDEGVEWYEPDDPHGTVVAGILGAINNDIGIRGVVDAPKQICWLVARVFGDASTTNYLSATIAGLEWAQQQGAHIINLSLGSTMNSTPAEAFYNQLQAAGILTIASAGNAGGTEYYYPASYDSVMSVAAVYDNLTHADFSQTNNAIDLAAPGVDIVSTATERYQIQTVTGPNVGTELAFYISLSPSIPYSDTTGVATLAGELIDCGLGLETCTPPASAAPHICLIARGEIRLEDKALNCQASGASAVILYNNVEEPMTRQTLSSPTSVTIPVLGLSLSQGQRMLAEVGQEVSVEDTYGYRVSSGTSYATPYVAAAAAVIWQACPACTNLDVRACLESTAEDLGDAGYDVKYGHGLVQIEPAYQCLIGSDCCRADATREPTTVPPTPVPTTAPPTTPLPTLAPTAATPCAANQPAHNACFASADQECTTCLSSQLTLIVGVADTCAAAEAMICDSFPATCLTCGGCLSVLQEYLVCLYGSQYDCAVACAPSPSAAPTLVDVPTVGPTTKPSVGPITAPVGPITAPATAPTAGPTLAPVAPTTAPATTDASAISAPSVGPTAATSMAVRSFLCTRMTLSVVLTSYLLL